MNFIYRFRSTEALLGKFQELEKQEIYLASPEELNDPLEDFKDVYWRGDEIVWQNLLRHYLRCLEHQTSLLLLSTPEDKMSVKDIAVFKIDRHFPTPMYSDLFKKISDRFFADASIKKFPAYLAGRTAPVRRHELEFYLQSMHVFALAQIYKAYEEDGLKPLATGPDPLKEALTTGVGDPYKVSINQIDTELTGKGRPGSEIVASVMSHVSYQTRLLIRLQNQSPSNPNRDLVLLDFPTLYIKALERLIYAEWYAACFASDCTSPAMWGYYGDAHKGVCLKFKVKMKDSRPYLPLDGVIGASMDKDGHRPIRGSRELPLEKVRYDVPHPEVDFFRMLGRANRETLTAWYSDENGKMSSCSEDILRGDSDWMKSYWASFTKCATTKLSGWEHEEEFRLVAVGQVVDYSEVENRKLRYNLRDLDGVIFGMNTPVHDKIQILKILDSKCERENYKDINFYQASYFRGDNRMHISNLGLLKID